MAFDGERMHLTTRTSSDRQPRANRNMFPQTETVIGALHDSLTISAFHTAVDYCTSALSPPRVERRHVVPPPPCAGGKQASVAAVISAIGCKVT